MLAPLKVAYFPESRCRTHTKVYPFTYRLLCKYLPPVAAPDLAVCYWALDKGFLMLLLQVLFSLSKR